MKRLSLLLPVICACTIWAGDSPVVAEVGTQPITLRQLEDALLRKEGREAMADWVSKGLDRLDFPTLKDDDIVLAIGFNKITRRELADALMRRGAAAAREDLINIAVVEQAMTAANILVTQPVLDQWWTRMARMFAHNLKAQGQGEVDFAQWIQNKEKMTPAEFKAQPAFRMMAGLHALVQQRAANEFPEDELQAWFAQHPERWRTFEAVELSVISVPYRKEERKEPGPSPAERERLGQVMDGLWRQINQGQVSFADTWQYFGRSYDPGANQGKVGWVRQDGIRDADGPKISKEVLAAAWSLDKFPVLLPPLADDRGVTIAVVHGHRPQRDPNFAEIRDQVRADRIDETLEARINALLADLRRSADVKLKSLTEAREK